MIRLSDTPFKDILPGSISGDPSIAAAADALDRELAAVTGKIDSTLVYHRLDELNGDILNLLAWQFSVDFFDINLPDNQKRNAIRKSIAWHRKKGTPWAVRTALANAGYMAQIFTFREFREELDAAGSLRLNSAWGLDGSMELGSLFEMTGSAWMEHWAQFCVKLDLLSFERPGFESEVRHLVDVAKNARSHPVYCYFVALNMDVPVEVESFGSGLKAMGCLPRRCDTLLDGSWAIGTDSAAVGLDGSWALDGSVHVGLVIPAAIEARIVGCRLSGDAGGGCSDAVSVGEAAVAKDPWFRLETALLHLDGTWCLGGSLEIDGSWQLDGGEAIAAPRLGLYAVNQLDSLLKIGLVPPESETWPQVSGGVYGSSSIN